MTNHPGEFADGLTAWIRGDNGPEAEAASIQLAEILILHRAWIKSHEKR